MIDQGRTLINRRDPVASRESCVDFRDLALEVLHDERRIAALGHEHDAFDNVVTLIDPCNSRAGAQTQGDIPDIGNQDGFPALCGDHHIAHILWPLEQAKRPDGEGFVAPLQDAATRVGAVGTQGLGDLVQRDAILAHPFGIHLDLQLANGAPETCDIGDAGDESQAGAYHPILNGAGFGQVRAGGRVKDVAIDFANRGCKRRK